MSLQTIDERLAWLQRRRAGIGASDVAGILGISSHSSQWSIWAEKSGLLPLDTTHTNEQRFGIYAELMVAPWFLEETGLHVIGAQTECVSPEAPWQMCTLDGFVAESPNSSSDDALGLIEIKSRQPGKRWEIIPADIQAQCQWQMLVTGYSRVWIAVLMGRRLDVHDLERNDGDIAFIQSRVERFWRDHVLAGDPPPTDGHQATLDAIAAVYPTATPDKSVSLDELADVIDEWHAAGETRRAAEKVEKEAKAAIQAALGDAEEGTVAGERVVSWRAQTRKSYVVEEATFRVLRATSKKSKEQAA